jgi:hypothetical protein
MGAFPYVFSPVQERLKARMDGAFVSTTGLDQLVRRGRRTSGTKSGFADQRRRTFASGRLWEARLGVPGLLQWPVVDDGDAFLVEDLACLR